MENTQLPISQSKTDCSCCMGHLHFQGVTVSTGDRGQRANIFLSLVVVRRM